MTPPRFRIAEGTRGPGAVTLRLEGELDAHVAPELADTVLAGTPGCEVVRLDVSGLQFIDSTGVRALVELEERLRRDGRRLQLEDPTANVVRVLRIADLDQRFGVG